MIDVLSRDLDAVLDAALAERRLVGAFLLVLQDGQPVYQRCAGLADREAGRALTADAIFRLASLTKPIVTAAAMALVESGKIRLSDPITAYLPDFRPRLADGTEPVITLHQLLTHTAGLSYGFLQQAADPYPSSGISDGLDAPGRSFADNLQRIASVSLAYPPGHSWRYSVALDVLGAALERATGETLRDLVRRLVTGPLGMADTGFDLRDPQRLAVAYGDGQDAPVRLGPTATIPFAGASGIKVAPERYADPGSFPSGGAGMLGTMADFARFLECMRCGGAPILQSGTVAGMTRNQIGDLLVDVRGPGWGFGYGWSVLTDPALAASPQHAGTLQWGGVYGHSWFVDPVARLTVIGLTNTAVAGMTGAFPMAVRDAVYRIDWRGLDG
jgi:CubicO group peptidase (beta-lactamase class C family)